MTKQDKPTNQNSKEDVVIGSVKRDPLKLFRKKEQKYISSNATKTDSHSQASSKPDPIVGNIKNNHFKFINKFLNNKKIVYICIAVILVVFLSLIAVQYLTIINNNKNIKEAQSKYETLKEDLSKDLDRSLASDNFDGATELINNSELANTLDADLMLAKIKISQKDYNGAILILDSALLKYGENIDIAYSLAFSYEQLGNKEKAIVFYQKYVDLLKKEKFYPMQGSNIAFYENKIEELKDGI